MPDRSPPPVPSPTTTPAGTFLSVDLCPRHGFAMLAMATLDDSGFGGGRRLLGPKSCCAERREVARWQVSPDDLERIAAELAPPAPPPPARQQEPEPGRCLVCGAEAQTDQHRHYARADYHAYVSPPCPVPAPSFQIVHVDPDGTKWGMEGRHDGLPNLDPDGAL